jgi:hypothetical protein
MIQFLVYLIGFHHGLCQWHAKSEHKKDFNKSTVIEIMQATDVDFIPARWHQFITPAIMWKA